MFCKNCGTELSDGSKFCPSCGTAVDSQSNNPNSTTDSNSNETKSPAPIPNTNLSTNPEAIVLKSSAPFPSKWGWFTWAFIAVVVIGIINIAIGFFAFAIIAFVANIQYSSHKDKLRKIKFKFLSPVSVDEIYNRLQPALNKKYGDKITFDRDGDTLSVHYDSIIYDINLNDDGTFCVWWRKSIAGAIFSFNENKLYRKIRSGTAIVAYELQQQFGIN